MEVVGKFYLLNGLNLLSLLVLSAPKAQSAYVYGR